MKKIVFFFPWKDLSGGPYYFCHLADDLAATGKYEVYYTDYYNGLSDRLLNDFRIRKIPYFGKAHEMELFLDEPIILITPIYWAFVVPKLHPESKVLFVNWHNECIPDLRSKWKTDEKTKERFLRDVCQFHAVFFADKAHLLAQNMLTGLKYDEMYVPITGTMRERRARAELISNRECNIAILGRLSPDKIYADIDLLDNIAASSYGQKRINVHLIGDGTSEKELYKKEYPRNINIIKYGTLPIEEVLDILASKVDILFAMGTSALEGASIGLPTVIIPNEVRPFHCNRYAYLSQSKGYALGWSPEQAKELGIQYQDVDKVFKDIYEDRKKAQIGEACYSYLHENHSSNIESMEIAIEKCEYYYAKLHLLIRTKTAVCARDFRRVCASINETKEKILHVIGKAKKNVCLLGLPVLSIRKKEQYCTNVFLLCIPFLRIKREGKCYSISFLPFVWVVKAFLKILKRIEDQKRGGSVDLRAACKEEIARKRVCGEKIRVCLFEPRISCWQFGNLYRLLEESGIFEPIVVVVPFLTMGKDAMIEYMETTFEILREQGYRVIKGYEKETDVFLNIREELKPDAVLYSMFWKNHMQEETYINRFEDIYTFLYPYGYDIVAHPDREAMNFELQNKVSRYYLPTKIHKGIAEDNMDNHAKNVYITGSPKLDYLIDKTYVPTDPWRCSKEKKRVIWAPHHTLEEVEPYYQLCAFLDLSDYMLEIAQEYQEEVQFAFKPHPMLRPRLYKMWGKQRTDEYYARWSSGINTQLEEGEFINLFLTSDAMIMDSLSFIAEYTIIDKPAFFTYGEKTRFSLNRFGRAIINVLYRNKTQGTLFKDIRNFLDEVVLSGKDEKKERRRRFIEEFMLPENGKTAAENIFSDMSRVILEDRFIEYKIDWDATNGGKMT